jgi:hypothetical protein
VPSLFRRKNSDLVEDAAEEATTESGDVDAERRPRGCTPGKGRETPKRPSAQRRRASEPAPTNRRAAYRRARETRKAERAEAMQGMRAGDERYLLARDRGPERALARDIVDSRRTVGTWFFGGALIVLIGSSGAMPVMVRLASNLLWALLAVGVLVDSVLISAKVKKLVRQRFPKTTQRMGSLYLYAVMRAITFRRMRMPKPRVKIGTRV